MRPFNLMALLMVLALVFSAGCAEMCGTEAGRGGAAAAAPAPQGQTLERQGAVAPEAAAGAGGAAAASGLSPEQLGPCRWVISGMAEDVNPANNTLVVSTEAGNQPLNITSQSVVRDQKAKEIALSDIKPGDQVVASFHRENGCNIVGHIYMLPQKEAGAGGGAAMGGGAKAPCPPGGAPSGQQY